MRNHKIRKIFAFMAYFTMLLGVFTLSKNSFSWFDSNVSIDDDVFGQSAGAYFAYGKGTKEKPYGIKSPRHLYNLAWLQYLGKFNGGDTEFYFELADDLNMEGWTLPPIGTTKYPFIGHFSGSPEGETKKYTISNLTIANTAKEMTKIPYAVKSSNDYIDKNKELSNIDIVGVFGCIGDIEGYTGDTLLKNGKAQTDSETATLHDFGLLSIHVSSQTENTLAGICAGYVNLPISEVVIKTDSNLSSSDIVTEKGGTVSLTKKNFDSISEYTSIGYCEDEYKTTTVQQKNEVYDPYVTTTAGFTAGGEENEWGGSLDMTEFYSRIVDLSNNYASTISSSNYSVEHKIVLDSNGDLISCTYGNKISAYSTRTGNGYHYFDGETKSSATYNEKIGSLNAYKDTNYSYYYLNGGSKISSIEYSLNYDIKSDDHHLSLSEDGTSIVDSGETKYTWVLPSLSNQSNASSYSFGFGYIYSSDGTTNCYLSQENGVLTITTDEEEASKWCVTQNSSGYIVSYGPYRLEYQNGWTLTQNLPSSFTVKRTIGNTTYYLSVDSTSYDTSNTYYDKPVYYFSMSQTNSSNATEFYLGESMTISNTTYSLIYTKIGNEYYYLEHIGYTDTGGDKYANKQFYLTKTLDGSYLTKNHMNPTTNGFKILNDNTKPGTSVSYFTRNSGSVWGWCYGSSSDYAVSSTNPSSATINSYLTFAKGSAPSSSKYTANSDIYYDFKDVTYLPLTVYSEDEDTHLKYEPKSTNSGYMVGGTGEGSSYYSPQYGNIVVSDYGTLSNNLTSYSTFASGDTDSAVYTVLTGSTTTTTIKAAKASGTEFAKYETSLSNFKKTLANNTSGTYGFNFENASISREKVITADYVSINGKEYTDYELPVNCLDFNLQSKGYINCFAGTYASYGNSGYLNNCFFSLHEIIRDSSKKISNILEIQSVYKNTNDEDSGYLYEYYTGSSSSRLFSYPFKYKDGIRVYDDTSKGQGDTQTLSSIPSGYEKIFDSYQLGNHSGTDTGSTIRSAINQHTRSFYYYEIPVNDGEFALGSVTSDSSASGAYLMYLDIQTNAAKMDRTTILEKFVESKISLSYPTGILFFDEKKNFCIQIPEEYIGKISIIETATSSVSIANTSNTEVNVTYQNISAGIHEDSNQHILLKEGSVSETQTVERLTYIDYNHTDGSLTMVVITKKDETNSATTYRKNGDEWVEDSTVHIYKVNNDNTSTLVTDITSIDVSYSNPDNTNPILSFSFALSDGNMVSITYNLNTKEVTPPSTEKFYAIDNYEIIFTLNGTNVTITLTNDGTGNYSITIENGDEVRHNP